MTDLDILAAEALGMQILNDGQLPAFRKRFSLSRTKTAQILGASTRSVKEWEESYTDQGYPRRVNSMSAARIGQLVHQLKELDEHLSTHGIQASDLVPLNIVTSLMGISVKSPMISQMCLTRKITCYDLKILGTYIPRTEAEALVAPANPITL